MPLANIKNAAAKELVTAMKQAELSDKTIVNYIHVLQSVIASVVSGEGEQVHPRTWDSHFIRLPVVNPKKQNRPTRTAKEIEQIVAAVTGRYRVLYALLAGSGLRIGEALSIKIGPMSDDCSTISGECSTIYVRQAVWRGKEQDPKTPAAVRDVDIPKELTACCRNLWATARTGFCSARQAASPYHHAISFETACILCFANSSNRERVSTAFDASVNPCCRCQRLALSWLITGWAMRTATWARATRSN